MLIIHYHFLVINHFPYLKYNKNMNLEERYKNGN